MFGKRVLNASRKHAEKVYPQEAVGIVVAKKYVPLVNTHSDPEHFFDINYTDLLKNYDPRDIQAVIHSHPIDRGAGEGPSEGDMQTQLSWGLPFGIQLITAAGAGNILWWGDDVPIAEYEWRPYYFGIYDCYSIARDFYRKEFGITFKDYARSEDFDERNNDLYGKHIESEGFVRLANNRHLQRGDIILVTVRSRVPNHCVVALGDGTCLHHPSGSRSKIDPIGPYIDPDRPFFHSSYRHKSFLDGTS